jgi:SAM-dependent methyltransferase
MAEDYGDWASPGYLLGTQYSNSARLAARADIHAKYGRGDWFAWLASQLSWPVSGDILEIGCGAGWFWSDARRFAGSSLRLTLTDLSPGMVAEAVERVSGLGHWAQVNGQVADASALPFPDASFDVAVASHMLYHLPSPSAGVAEIARVLRPGGLALVATNGMNNMRELFDLPRQVFGEAAGGDGSRRFALENGGPMLEEAFGKVQLLRYLDELLCTNPGDVFSYLTSSPPSDRASEAEAAALHRVIDQAFNNASGTFTISKNVGAFLCEKSLG